MRLLEVVEEASLRTRCKQLLLGLNIFKIFKLKVKTILLYTITINVLLSLGEHLKRRRQKDGSTVFISNWGTS